MKEILNNSFFSEKYFRNNININNNYNFSSSSKYLYPGISQLNQHIVLTKHIHCV